MLALDLMIGDWVIVGNQYAQVTSITCDGIIETDVRVSNEEITEPIPLTPEILKRNRFKEYEEDYHNEYVYEKCDGTSYYEIVISWKDSFDNGALDAFNHVQWDEGWKLSIESEGSYNKGWCKTIYVHELQHAARLCGLIELADNFKVE